jgi:hypothetical protein
MRGCPLCDLRFYNLPSMVLHLNQYHGIPDDLLMDYVRKPVCPKCRKPGSGYYVKSVRYAKKTYRYQYFAHRVEGRLKWCYLGPATSAPSS